MAALAGPTPPQGPPPIGVVATYNIGAGSDGYCLSKELHSEFENKLREDFAYFFEARFARATRLCCNARPNGHHMSTALLLLGHRIATTSPPHRHLTAAA